MGRKEVDTLKARFETQPDSGVGRRGGKLSPTSEEAARMRRWPRRAMGSHSLGGPIPPCGHASGRRIFGRRLRREVLPTARRCVS